MSSSSIGMIIFCVVGVLVCGAFVAFEIYNTIKERKKRKQQKENKVADSQSIQEDNVNDEMKQP